MSELGKGGAKSRKPGNITLNWRKLFELIPDVTLAGASVVGAQWLIPFAALYIWTRVWQAAAVELEEEDAFVVYSLWLHRNDRRRLTEDEAFLQTKALSKKHGLPAINKKKFKQIINKLLSLECIEMNNDVIRLRERVVIKYGN